MSYFLIVVVMLFGFESNATLAGENTRPDTDARLHEILTVWKATSKPVFSFYAAGRRVTYDRVFELETRAKFEFVSVEKLRWLNRIEPAEISTDERSSRVGKLGKPFVLRNAGKQAWFANGEAVWLDESEENVDSESFARGLSRFGDFMHASTMLSFATPLEFWNTHRFELISDTADSIEISAVPTRQIQAATYRSMQFVLDPQTLQTRSVKILDPTENRETVYVFESIHINGPIDGSLPLFAGPWNEFQMVGKIPVEDRIVRLKRNRSNWEYLFDWACYGIQPGDQDVLWPKQLGSGDPFLNQR